MQLHWLNKIKETKAKKANEDVHKSVNLHSGICTLKRHGFKIFYVGQTDMEKLYTRYGEQENWISPKRHNA
jgi:hypothetical protein